MIPATMTIVRNPFEPQKNRSIRQVVPGVTVGHALREYGVSSELQDLVVSVNGKAVTDLSLKVESGDWLTVAPRIHGGGGGGGGKNLLAIVAGIALMVVSMGVASVAAGGAFFGAGMVTPALFSTGWLLGMAVMTLGGLLLQSLFPAPQMDLGEFASGDWTKTQTYGWGTMKSLQGQGYAIGVTFGDIFTAGQLLASHVTTDGDKQYLNLLLSGGEGPLDYINNLTIDGNPIANYDGVTVDYRLGLNDQTVIPNFADTYADQALNYDLAVNNPAVQQTEGNAGQGLEVTVELPSGLYYGNDQGGLDSATVRILAEYRIVGAASYATWGQWDITAASNGAVRRVYRLDNLTAGQYEVRLTCTYKSGETSRYSTRAYWTQLTHIMYDDFALPNLALVGIRALATDQLSGSMPELKWGQGRANIWAWNSNTASYESRPANRPAWACYDLAHYARRLKDVRTGQWVYVVKGRQADRLDHTGFLAWATMNIAKNLTFDHYYEQASEFWAAMKLPETVGRGKVIMKGTSYTPIWDDAKQPVQMFTVGNSNNFRQKFLPMKDRANAVEVTFFDRERKGERRVITVPSDNYKNEVPNPTQITLYGVTTLDQAWREGKYRLRLNLLTRTCTWDAGVDAIACQVGDLVLVQNDVPQWGFGGRIVSSSRTEEEPYVDTVTLDRKVSMVPGTTDEVKIRLADVVDMSTGQPRDKYITMIVAPVDEPTETNVLTLEELCEYMPAQFDVYSFGEQNISTKPFVVLRITRPTDQDKRQLTGLEYIEEIYTEATDVPDVEYSALVGTAVISGLATDQRKLGSGNIEILVSWFIDRGNYGSAIVLCDGKLVAKTTMEKKCRFVVGSNGIYTITVIASDAFGNQAGSGSTIIHDSSIFVPPDVTTLFVNQLASGRKRFSWNYTYPVPNDVAGFRIKIKPVTRSSWDSSQNLFDGIVAASPYETDAVLPGQYVVLVKAVDTNGNESVNSASVSVGLGDEIVQNVIVSHDLAANGFVGTKIGCSVVGGDLVANDSGGLFWPPDEYPFWPEDTEAFWQSQFEAMVYEEYVAIEVGQFLLQLTTQGSARVLYAQSPNFWPADTEPFWPADDQPFWPTPAASDYQSYMSKIITAETGYFLRVEIDGGPTQGKITRFVAIIDVPDESETVNNVAISAGGTRLPITKSYLSILNVAATLQDDGGTAFTVKCIDKDPILGPIMKCYNIGGVSVSGTIDATIQGVKKMN